MLPAMRITVKQELLSCVMTHHAELSPISRGCVMCIAIVVICTHLPAKLQIWRTKDSGDFAVCHRLTSQRLWCSSRPRLFQYITGQDQGNEAVVHKCLIQGQTALMVWVVRITTVESTCVSPLICTRYVWVVPTLTLYIIRFIMPRPPRGGYSYGTSGLRPPANSNSPQRCIVQYTCLVIA